MPRPYVRATVAVSLFFTAACTQPPATVELRGSHDFARNAVSQPVNTARNGGSYKSSFSYASNAPSAYEPPPVYTNTRRHVSQATERSAGVQSIGVSDLAPPPKNGKVASDTRTEAQPVKQASAAPAQKVNQWTGRSREIETSQAQDVTILNRPVLTNNKSAGKVKPVKLIGAKQEQGSFMWPVSGKKIVSSFGPKNAGKVNDGINIASGEGEPVWASSDGEVVYVGNELQGYGNMVLIKHAGNKSTSYAHLARSTVDKYDRVKQGDIIGYVGATGNVNKPQLHFAIRDGKNPVDPKKYLSTSVAGL